MRAQIKYTENVVPYPFIVFGGEEYFFMPPFCGSFCYFFHVQFMFLNKIILYIFAIAVLRLYIWAVVNSE